MSWREDISVGKVRNFSVQVKKNFNRCSVLINIFNKLQAVISREMYRKSIFQQDFVPCKEISAIFQVSLMSRNETR